jgi:DNA-binding LytR/AlgR family response regulator
LFSYEDNKAVDILLLDIQMGEMDGVELAKRIRADNKEVQIIFVTGYMEYIADGYDVEALHYLLKPVTEEKLEAILNRALVKLAGNERAIYINRGSENIRIPVYEIRYLEVRHNYVTVCANEEFTVKKTLMEMEKELDDSFFRTGRSHVVNLKYIRKVTKTEVHLKDGTLIPLSRGLYNKLNRAMIERL